MIDLNYEDPPAGFDFVSCDLECRDCGDRGWNVEREPRNCYGEITLPSIICANCGMYVHVLDLGWGLLQQVH